MPWRCGRSGLGCEEGRIRGQACVRGLGLAGLGLLQTQHVQVAVGREEADGLGSCHVCLDRRR